MKKEIKNQNQKNVLDLNTVKTYLSRVAGVEPNRVNIERTGKVSISKVDSSTMVDSFLVQTSIDKVEIININKEPHIREEIILNLFESWGEISSEKMLNDLLNANNSGISDETIEKIIDLPISLAELKRLKKDDAIDIIRRGLNLRKELKNIINLCYYETDDLICLRSYQRAIQISLNI